MHEQIGSFQGVNTCDVCSADSFSLPSMIHGKSEWRTIINRPDINAYLDKMNGNGFLTKDSVEARLQRARVVYPDIKTLESYYNG